MPGRFSLVFVAALSLAAQEGLGPRDVRELAKAGSSSIPKLQELLKDPDLGIRLEAVKGIVEIGTAASLDPLIQATADADPEVQIRATDGLVDFYLPGYVRTGLGASLRRVGNSLKGRFNDAGDQLIDPYITVRPEVVEALGKLVRGAENMDVRANAARALGILRGSGAIPDLLEAVRSKDTNLIFESLIAFQKLRDQSVAPKISFLLRDLNQKVQVAAIETTGLLQNKEALPQLKQALSRTRDNKVRRAALTAIAMLPDETSRNTYEHYLQSSDDRLRGAAAEGYARLKNQNDLPKLEQAFLDERKTSPRLSLAFAMVMLGKSDLSESSPLRVLVTTLNSRFYRGEALALLTELARNPAVRTALYRPLVEGTKDEKINLARVMAGSGDQETLSHLEKVSQDRDGEVAQEGLRALRTLKARL